MRRLLRRLGIAASIVIAAFALSLSNTGQAIAQNMKPILAHVVNTVDAPVVTRDLSDVAARTAFSEEFSIEADPGGSVPVNIPSGRRLVLEAVSVSGDVNRDGFHPKVLLTAVTGTDVASYALALTEVDPAGPIRIDPAGNPVMPADTFAGTQLLRLYADSLQISVRYTDSTVEGTFMVTVSGYLVGQP